MSKKEKKEYKDNNVELERGSSSNASTESKSKQGFSKYKTYLSQFNRKKILASKLRVFFLLVLGVGALSVLISLLIDGNAGDGGHPQADSEHINLIDTSSAKISTEEMWRRLLEEKITQTSELGKQNMDLIKKDMADIKTQTMLATESKLEERLKSVAQEIEVLRNSANDQQRKAVKPEETKPVQISQFDLGLSNAQNSDKYKPIKTADNYIPAGSYAKARLLSGVDAETSLHSSSDPEPILIRITDHGTLPRRFKSDLKDCHVIAAAYGNLSSQRVKVRLEKLSCTEIKTGEIVETEVAGFVSGSDGRAGIRGSVVSTEGKLVSSAFFAGTLGGLASNFSPTSHLDGQNILVENPQKPSMSDKFKNSGSSGLHSSLDRLAKYYIDRAETLQPVVQVSAGQEVDVIFTEGVFFGTSHIKREIAKRRDTDIRNTKFDDDSGEGTPRGRSSFVGEVE